MNSKKSNILFLPTSPTPLHRELADRITHLIHKEGLEPGARLNENKLAEELVPEAKNLEIAKEVGKLGGLFKGKKKEDKEKKDV